VIFEINSRDFKTEEVKEWLGNEEDVVRPSIFSTSTEKSG
jgi:hypothetical protein